MRRRHFGGGFGFHLDITPMVRKLLIANFAVWALQVIFGLSGSALFETWFALDTQRALPWRPWQLFTYMFLHSAPGPGHPWGLGGMLHIVVNMGMLAIFGGAVEARMGSQRFWRYYVVCGLAGGLLSLLPPFAAGWVVGASGAILGVLVAFALFYPDAPIYFIPLFPPFPARWVVLLLALVNLMSAHRAADSGIAYMAHLGGMAAGYIMLRGLPFSGGLRRRWRDWRRGTRVRRSQEMRQELDAILDKMHQEGKESLSQEEWNILLDASRRRRHDN